MILTLDDTERAELLAQVLAERFTRHTPDPIPIPEPSSVTAHRRRQLCLSIDGYFRDDLPLPEGVA